MSPEEVEDLKMKLDQNKYKFNSIQDDLRQILSQEEVIVDSHIELLAVAQLNQIQRFLGLANDQKDIVFTRLYDLGKLTLKGPD